MKLVLIALGLTIWIVAASIICAFIYGASERRDNESINE
jgi:hypothetical protein